MNFGDSPASTQYEDHTLGDWVRSQMGTNLWQTMLRNNNVSGRGAPHGYDKWLEHTLSRLSPQDAQIMQAHGMSIEDIHTLHALMKGRLEIDPSAYPYNEDAANAAVKRIKERRLER